MTLDEYFAQSLDRAIAAEEADTGWLQKDWFRAGPKNSHDREWWLANGPRLVSNFTNWYEANDDVSVWIAPDGRPAIELGLIVMFGTVPVKMFIDVVLVMGSALVVVDLKSGAKTPDSLAQLSIYACGLELAYGRENRPRYGSWFMLRGSGKPGTPDEEKTYFQTPTELTGYQHSVPWWTRQFALLDQAVENGTFVARVGEHCKRCGVAYACPAVGGAKASLYDSTLKGALV